MFAELHGKGGNLCQQARAGQVRCPLIVRPTSEDVITGQIVQALGCLNSRWWLPDLLNAALGEPRFRRQYHRRLRIEPWVNKPPYPRELLPWAEGSTQVDICITYENQPVTIFVEAKYGSGLSTGTANHQDGHGYPGDQLIRNIRVGLHECGYFDGGGSLFPMPRRDFVMILLTPSKGHPLVEAYRDPERLKESIPHADRLTGLPSTPFVAELSYADLIDVLAHQSRWFTRAERSIVGDLMAYLEFKLTARPSSTGPHRCSPVVPGSS